MRRYITLWSICAQKWPCSKAEWSELPWKTQSFETVTEKYPSSDVSTILLTDEKIFTVVTPKTPKNRQLCATAVLNQEERRHDKTLALTVCIQTVTDGIGRRVTSGRENQVWYLSITESRLLRAAIKAVITVTANHASDLKRVLHLLAGQCSANMALEAFNFLTDNFACQISTDFKISFKAVLVEDSSTHKSRCYTTLWFIVHHRTRFRLLLLFRR